MLVYFGEVFSLVESQCGSISFSFPVEIIGMSVLMIVLLVFDRRKFVQLFGINLDLIKESIYRRR